MKDEKQFELWWRAFPALEWTVEYFSKAHEYHEKKRQLKKNLDDSFFDGIEILPFKTRSLK